ncbi:hypothetical protein EDB83DRAFT_2406995 [Lactarius deliciosus]|nr:hypothetical protein EDB83DRAFT_2406995 [Lactarius deliciosus]
MLHIRILDANAYGHRNGTSRDSPAQMLFEHRADADIRDNYRGAPLHLSVRVMNEAEGRQTIGMTPLHCASQHGQPEIAQLLLDHGANAHVEDVQGRNPLHEVSQHHRFGNGPVKYTRRAGLLIDAYHPRPCVPCLDGVMVGLAGLTRRWLL